MTALILLLIGSTFAGFLGSLLGLGGGLILVPLMTLGFHLDIRSAVAASLVAIIASSSGATAQYLADSLTNLRLAIFLEVATVSGALVGYFLSLVIQSKSLFLLFGILLLFTAFVNFRSRGRADVRATADHPWAQKLQLSTQEYMVENVPLGLVILFFAGIISALLGIGSGIFKVLSMDSVMKIPLKISSATSNFMIGVTAVGSAAAYFVRGDVRPELAGPVAIGVLLGAFVGAKVMPKTPVTRLRKLFLVVLVVMGVQMFWRGLA